MLLARWIMSLFNRAPAPAMSASVMSKADRAICSLDEATEASRSLTAKLQRVYAERGRDGFKAFVSDVALAEQLDKSSRGHITSS